ncbi:MAG: hypothetical protein J6X80_09505 [Lachnospiraceae bacterium]|nr:hypothetical protein [Lachnospiraceae bacterium]
MEEKEKKSLWPVFLILGIVVLLAAIFLALCLGIVGFFLLVSKPRINSTYSYANTVANMNTSNKPATVTTSAGSPYDYTFVNNVLTKDETQVDAWINNYYPGSSVQKTNYSGSNDAWWVVTPTSPMNPVSINGFIVNYDSVEFHFRDGYAERISFILDGDITVFNSMYNDISAIYGQQQPYVGQNDLLTKLTDPGYEYVSYAWYESDFDGFYSLSLTRTNHQSQEKIDVSIMKY